MKRNRRRDVVVLAIVGVLAAGGGALAASTGGGGDVQACAQKVNGQLRLDVGDGCRPSEVGVTLAGGGAAAPTPMYARVEHNELDTARSQGVVAMTTVEYDWGSGNPYGQTFVSQIYCFDLTAPVANVQATDGSVFPAGTTAASVAGTDAFAATGCPATADAAVWGRQHSQGTAFDDQLYVSFQQ